MVASAKKYPLGSPQEHIVMCESHDIPIDMICEDCDEFICARCAKTDHKDHDWKTLTTAATQRRRGLLKFLKKIKEEDLLGIDEKIEKMSIQISENKELCESEIKKLQRSFDQIMTRLKNIGKCHKKTLRDDLVKKDDQLNHVKSNLEKKKKE
ncbi:tripartite motif-containing protein 75-like [Saccostrea cucullata]|uniref:tripartite motif-containing protein 75-like n=1 Tax=Saccostrea cuccullata TaxID=36930 RepID=UPI002ED1C76E